MRTGFEHRILNKLVSPWPLFIKYYVPFPPQTYYLHTTKSVNAFETREHA